LRFLPEMARMKGEKGFGCRGSSRARGVEGGPREWRNGRRTGFRIQRATVGVRIPPLAPAVAEESRDLLQRGGVVLASKRVKAL
jgi:hypothetical protein